MKIEIAKPERMSESGSSLLSIMQSKGTTLLDLLIRESIQNSLDAYDKDPQHKAVNVDISVNSFNSKELNVHFDGIALTLDKRYPNSRIYQSLIIRDSNTMGLTGPVDYADISNNEYGNLMKLVYEISKPQTAAGAGGAWGLGKTIYFRVGMGLVLYYSRIKTNTGYQSRLAACLVEDETKSNSLLPTVSKVKRGIAWWGKEGKEKNTTVPITDLGTIRSILKIFDAQEYTDSETGTTIIIPYVDSKKLLKETYSNDEASAQKPYWTNTLEDYLRIAVQRWYAPRILNTKYITSAYLSPSVNGVKIKPKEFLPLFRIVRELYIYAKTEQIPDESFIDDQGVEFQLDNIVLNSLFKNDTSAGKFVHVKMNRRQMKMLAPDFEKSPYQQITNKNEACENGNAPIIMYTRQPGMIVGYDFKGPWTHSMLTTGEDEYIIGLFVLASKQKFKEDVFPNHPYICLEEYIRKGEKADHTSWNDHSDYGKNIEAVDRIKKSVIKKINGKYEKKSTQSTAAESIGLGRQLANLLLPSTGFGKRISPKPKPDTKQRSGTRQRSRAAIENPIYNANTISIKYKAIIQKGTSLLNLLILTDNKSIDANIWEKDDEISSQFPLEIKCFTIDSCKAAQKRTATLLELPNGILSNGIVTIEMNRSNKFFTESAVRITSSEVCELAGEIVFSSTDSDIKFSIGIKEV